MSQSGAALRRRHTRRAIALALLASYISSAVAGMYAFMFFELFPADRPTGEVLRLAAPVTVVLLAACSVVGSAIARWRLRRALGWLDDGRTANEHEVRLLVGTPLFAANLLAALWLPAASIITFVTFASLNYTQGPDVTVRAIVGLALITLVPWGLAMLFVERTLRPVVGRALESSTAEIPRTIGVPARLVLAWATTGALPATGIAIIVTAPPTYSLSAVRVVVLFICILSLVAGGVVAVFSGRAIIDPLTTVRRGLRSVERGDLASDVPVTESSELGELQIGFNRMVAGLRERDRMRDIFGRHVGDQVAARALSADPGLTSERVEASAMFIDVIASTELAQRAEPEDVVAALNGFFDAVVACVGAEGGIVNKFLGDGALCVFGAHDQRTDHATCALRAARALHRRMRDLSSIDAAIGVSSGEVVAGNVGSADRYEYTVIGDPVNEASRLCDAAKDVPARVLVSDSTVHASGEEYGWQTWGQIGLRGRREPTHAYTLKISPSI